ncbi:hypothetical protein Tco_0106591 [Tanacetum coccineum]
MRLYGSTTLSTRAGKFSISSESNGLITQPEGNMSSLSMMVYVYSCYVAVYGGSISPEGFLPSILLMVFMVTVVIVAVILVVVVIVIFGVVVVVGGVSSIIKLSFMIIGFLLIIVFYYLLHQPLGYGNDFLQSLRL